jgi:hypothetical protein
MSGIKLPQESKNIPGGIYPAGAYTPSGIFSLDAHENLIRSKGFRALHFRHALNPARATPEEGVDLKNMDMTGYTFYDQREVYIAPQNLNWQESYMVYGTYGKHTMVCNHTGRYTDDPNTRVYLRPGDLVAFKDSGTTTVMMKELLASTMSGTMRPRFPVFSVDYLASSNKRYEEGSDFSVVNGEIVWNPGINPPFDVSKNQGTVLSCVYWTRPLFVVVDTPKLFRMSWANEYAEAYKEADATYFPGSVVLSMAWLHPSAKFDNIIWPSQE